MVFKLVFLVLDVLVSPPASTSVDDDEMTCDDGSLAWDPNDGPNWACHREGCTPHDKVCWSDRLAYCTDELGKDLGVCVYERDECHGRLDCFDMWLYCAGTYECVESGVVGCVHGVCTTSGTDADGDRITSGN
jgi:hypothetical protein